MWILEGNHFFSVEDYKLVSKALSDDSTLSFPRINPGEENIELRERIPSDIEHLRDVYLSSER